GSLETLVVWWVAAGSFQCGAAACEDVCRFDNAAFAAPGDGHNLPQTAAAITVEVEMNDEVDGGSDRGHDECRGDVLAGQQGKRDHFRDGVPSGSGVNR